MGSDSITSVKGLASGTFYSPAPYADNLSGATGTGLNNYAISYTNGSLMIGQAPLVVNGVNNTTQYNGVSQTNGVASYTGAKGSDIFLISGYASATNYSPIPYSDNLSLSGNALSNYVVTYNNGSLGVSQATLAVTGTNNSVTYNSLPQSNTGATYSGQKGKWDRNSHIISTYDKKYCQHKD